MPTYKRYYRYSSGTTTQTVDTSDSNVCVLICVNCAQTQNQYTVTSASIAGITMENVMSSTFMFGKIDIYYASNFTAGAGQDLEIEASGTTVYSVFMIQDGGDHHGGWLRWTRMSDNGQNIDSGGDTTFTGLTIGSMMVALMETYSEPYYSNLTTQGWTEIDSEHGGDGTWHWGLWYLPVDATTEYIPSEIAAYGLISIGILEILPVTGGQLILWESN